MMPIHSLRIPSHQVDYVGLIGNAKRNYSVDENSNQKRTLTSEKRLVDNKKSPKINVKLTMYEDTSKYDGEPLIKPKAPY